MEKLLFSKSSDYRNHETNIKTGIVEIDGVKFAKKENAFPEGKKHLLSIVDNADRLKEIFEPEYEVCKCEKRDEAIYFDFISGDSFEKILSKMREDDDISGLELLIERYHTMVWKMCTSVDSAISSDFIEVFGDQIFETGTEFGDFVDVDLIFTNIIDADKPCIIDYEWCYDFPIPLKYVFWKGLFTSNAFSLLKEEVKQDIYEKYGLTSELRKQFLEMEKSFVNKTGAGNLSFSEETHNFRLAEYNPVNMGCDERNYPIACFAKKSGEIIEEVHKGLSYPGLNEIYLDLKASDYDRLEIFIAPDSSIICDIEVWGIDENGETKVEFRSTSETDDTDHCYFLKNTPVIIVEGCNFLRFKVKYSVSVWHEKRLSGDEFDSYLSDIKFTCMESIEKIQTLQGREAELTNRVQNLQNDVSNLTTQLEEKKRRIESLQSRNIFKAIIRFFRLRKEAKALK